MLNSMNFISTKPLCDVIGKADRNAACSPSGLRLAGGTSFCRKATYDSRCIVSRYGTLRTLSRLPKLLRIRLRSVKL